jgi:tetratricopeptide (TPR) repeat protein
MSAQISNQNVSTTSNEISVAITPISSSTTSHSRRRIAQNYSLVWIDDGIDETNKDCQNIIEQLRNVVNHINIFTNQDECVDFLTDLEDTKAFLIINDTIDQQLMSCIHNVPQLDKVYIFSLNKSLHNEWIKEWTKIKDVYTEIAPICGALQVAIKEFNQDSIAVSFVPANEISPSQNLDELNPSFMYTQIFKEILLEIKHDEKSLRDFIALCRSGNYGSLRNIELFEEEYYNKSAIWWYTWPAFVYPMLNYSLRTLKTDIIIKMGFFICDLHHQIEQLYQEQFSSHDRTPFILYRGQGLLEADFEKLMEAKGGLMSFNNFLSTSQNQEVSFGFAQIASTDTNMIGILFVMSIDPSVSSTPFASIKEYSDLREEEEFLFSMHTVFRINEIKPMDDTHRLYQIELQLTADDDEQLRILTKRIAEETKGDTGWKRLGNLLCRLDQLDTAEELYNALLEQASNDRDKMHYYSQLAHVKFEQGDSVGFFMCSSKTLEIEKKSFPANHPNLTTSDNNIVSMFSDADDYGERTVYYNKTHEFNEEMYSELQLLLTTHNSIAQVDDNDMNQSSKSLSFYNNALKTFEENLRSDYPDLPTSHNNIARGDELIHKSSGVIWFLEKTLEIRQRVLHPNHSDLLKSYIPIAATYKDQKEYSKALSFYEKAMKIMEINLLPNHPDLGTLYNNIGVLYENMEEYSKALSFYEKALHICQKSLPSTHWHLMNAYKNIASMYNIMKEYEKALEIQEKILPSNHPDLADSYETVARLYEKLEKYSEALPFYEKELEIHQAILPSNHPDLADSYSSVALIYAKLEKYSEALPFYKKKVEIMERNLPPTDHDLAYSYGTVAHMYAAVEEYSEALLFYKKAVEILETSLPPTHHDLCALYSYIAEVCYKMK